MLKLPIHVTHNLLSHPVVLFDVVYGRNAEGEAAATQEPDRTVVGNLQPAGYRQLQLLPEGAQTEGAKVFHTDAPVFVCDNGQGRQTYIRHGGQNWKCIAVEDWSPHATIGRWLATRHLDINTP